MISHGARCHAEFLGSLGKWLYLNRSVKEAVIGVKMKVNESLIRHIDYERLAAYWRQAEQKKV
jgi:hypothetical protein